MPIVSCRRSEPHAGRRPPSEPLHLGLTFVCQATHIQVRQVLRLGHRVGMRALRPHTERPLDGNAHQVGGRGSLDVALPAVGAEGVVLAVDLLHARVREVVGHHLNGQECLDSAKHHSDGSGRHSKSHARACNLYWPCHPSHVKPSSLGLGAGRSRTVKTTTGRCARATESSGGAGSAWSSSTSALKTRELRTGFSHEMICPVRSPCAGTGGGGGGGGGDFFGTGSVEGAFGFGVGFFVGGFVGGFVGALDGITRLRRAHTAVIAWPCSAAMAASLIETEYRSTSKSDG